MYKTETQADFQVLREVSQITLGVRDRIWPCTTVACRVYLMTSCTGSTSLNESSSSSLLWYDGVWRIKLRSTWAITALRSPLSAADTYDQLTSISWLSHCQWITFGRWAFSVAGPTVWNSLPTEFRGLSVGLVTLSARLRRYYSREISAFSAIEMFVWHCAI